MFGADFCRWLQEQLKYAPEIRASALEIYRWLVNGDFVAFWRTVNADHESAREIWSALNDNYENYCEFNSHLLN